MVVFFADRNLMLVEKNEQIENSSTEVKTGNQSHQGKKSTLRKVRDKTSVIIIIIIIINIEIALK